MQQKYISLSREKTWEIGKEVLSSLDTINVIALQGELGAGKTTFAQGLLTAVGAEGPFTSPTFVIMKKYDIKNPKYDTVYHFDCYRVVSNDILQLGWAELISNERNLILVEWPERIKEILPKQILSLEFKISGETEREIIIKEDKY